MLSTLFGFSLLVGSAIAAGNPLLEPSMVFEIQLTGTTSTKVESGNGVALSPDNNIVATSLSDGTIVAFDMFGGFLWRHSAPNEGGSMVHCPTVPVWADTGKFLVYAVVDNSNSASPETRILAVNRDGANVYESAPIPGRISGSPVIGTNGNFAYFTLNNAESDLGFFYIIDMVTQEVFNVNGTGGGTPGPFAPAGIFHSPDGGYYTGGETNTNDIICWLRTFFPTDTVASPGGLYCFQHEENFGGSYAGNPFLFIAGTLEATRYVSLSAPTIGNSGFGMWWSAPGARLANINGGVDRRDRNSFSMGFSYVTQLNRFMDASADLPGMLVPQAIPFRASPAVSTVDPNNAVIFGGGASTEFYRGVSSVNEAEQDSNSLVIAQIDLASLVHSQARICFDQSVYYIEENGVVHQASYATGATLETYAHTGDKVFGEFALSDDCSRLYFADENGVLVQLQVAELSTAAPTSQPTDTPTAMTAPITSSPTSAPTKAQFSPVPEPTLRPTDAPSVSIAPSTPSATSTPTSAPTPFPTPEPTPGPTTGPTFRPTTSPTRGLSSEPTGWPTSGPTPTPGLKSSPVPVPTPGPTLAPGPRMAPMAAPPSSGSAVRIGFAAFVTFATIFLA